MYKGIGPNKLGSPLKQTGRVMLDEATVTAKKPKSPPSLETKLQYGLATGQLEKLEGGKPKPITGNPPMVGGANAINIGQGVVKGFNVMKSAASTPKVAKALEFIGEAWETANLFKGKNKKNKK